MKDDLARWRHKCGAYGPDVALSSTYLRAACCNRIAGHKGDHVERKPDTFQIISHWRVARGAPEKTRWRTDTGDQPTEAEKTRRRRDRAK
jgi:hypothetical protein